VPTRVGQTFKDRSDLQRQVRPQNRKTCPYGRLIITAGVRTEIAYKNGYMVFNMGVPMVLNLLVKSKMAMV
jgi:hypothetical protein